MKVVLFGGSGFLGTGLRERLVAGDHEVIVVGRGAARQHDGWRSVRWDGLTLGPWADALDGADTVVHLAGKRVDCRPTKANIDELIRSREETVRLAGRAMQSVDDPPKSWIQLSSLAIYGDGGEVVIDEETPPPSNGPRQMVEVCQRWEAAYADATVGMQRTVLLRPAIGIGGAGDPATARLVQLAKVGLAGAVGGGQQWVSWIAAKDFFDLLERAVLDLSMTGLYHLTAPTPVRNHEMMAAYRGAVGRTFGLPAPALVTALGARLLGSDPDLALIGRRCVPGRLLNEGFEFSCDDFRAAVDLAVSELVT